MPDYPDFDEALRRFQKFVAMQGAPESVVFVSPEQVLLRGGRLQVWLPDVAASLRQARKAYQQALIRRHGVLIAGLCHLDCQLCSYVYGPNCEEEAVALMYPDGLKLSLRSPLPAGDPIKNRGRWRVLRALERRRPDLLMNQQEMFK